MKQEATNTFGEGIIMDLNPLTTPNNVLTSALNATMITYNGNEFVLQNDMGNGRVETAYLPSGYVPVGIKEYGGIIYVASYNPLTNKGQIGSFPSPERNISSNEIQGAQSVLTPSSFGALSNGILDTFVSKINIFPEGTIIRSGDKFTIMLDASKGSQIDTKILLSIMLPALFFTYVAPFSLYKEAPLEVVPNTRALPIPSPFMIIAPTELSDFWITNWPV